MTCNTRNRMNFSDERFRIYLGGREIVSEVFR